MNNPLNYPHKKLGEDVIKFYHKYKNPTTVWKKTVLKDVSFILPEYYTPVQLIGLGAYGAVAAMVDTRLPQDQQQEKMLAVKKMTNTFEHKIFARRILRQLKLLRLLRHQNIVEIKTIILPKSREQFDDLYVIFDLMDSDIFCLLKKGEQELNQNHYQCFIYQILCGLKYIHSAKVIHRDIKTRNLLINSNCDIKICDFGLARPMIQFLKQGIMTDYVATRWYRAPELLLGETNYTPAVDIWSVGCILAQLILRKPFLPATDTKQQLQLICQLVQPQDLEKLKQTQGQNYVIILKILQKKKKKKNLIDQKIKNVSPLIIDLLKKMLRFDPAQRLTAKQAIQHQFFVDFRQPETQVERQPINPLQFQFDNHNLTTEQLKDMIYQQILLYHFQDFRNNYSNKITNNNSVYAHIYKNSNSKNIHPEADNDD